MSADATKGAPVPRPIKAVIPAAGLGTRFLPATKAMPKEMLPVVDKPAIQYVVQEAVDAGLDDIIMITGRNKTPLENHFDRVPFIEATLEQKGDLQKLRAVNHSSNLADIHYLRQGSPKGLGHAVLRAKHHVGDSAFAVLLGDDLIDEKDSLLSDMLDVHVAKNASVIALMEVDPSKVHMYGVADAVPTDTPGVVKVRGLVEKPDTEDAPSNLAVIGRYVLRPEVFEVLAETQPGRGNEIQLTDALQVLAANDDIAGGVYGVVFTGKRYDTGDRLDYIKAVVQLALERPDLGPDLHSWLVDYLATFDAPEA